ncbi:helix-turn-helix transcriptional regulator [Chitinophaga niabensis]|uniref:DNA-binding transcriptional regulator, XRE family n=1 Tax=Chitinophaga niabensis TaxID=536979 RepID=A0A1N6KAS6_9BACT|nr:helix-turn-helix transcriptional regulator [Chitinophaga niabensis]SIO53694.1 DNA-binding transcriptional regulator, XRE family [Chitinophaga niabensis]
MAFGDLKDIAIALGIKKKIGRLRYNCIKAMLAAENLTSKELAEHIGVHTQTVSSWVTNVSQPRLDELYAVAAFLRIDPTDLLS